MLKDQSLAIQVLEITNTLIQAANYMYDCSCDRKYNQLESMAGNMIKSVEALYPYVNGIKEEIPYISAPASCENIIFSVTNILKYVKTRSQSISSKIEFELIPILQDLYYDLYFYTCVFGNSEKEQEHYTEEFMTMIGNHYIDQSMITGEYKYDISIAVLAYNKLDYTKLCVESILQYTPSDLNYELILIDNGSTDGTLEYFESLSPTKIFSLKQNSINIMTGAVSRIYEGRYQLTVSNDVIVTANYLENLLECIESDSKIAMVVPTTPNVSNFQSIDANYSTLEEMHSFAKENNVSNPLRWEERTRLCNPLTFCKSEVFFSTQGVGAIDKYFVYSEFGDDALALRLRRAGYKLILAKDCYCHHFGSVTLKEAQLEENTIEKSRNLFIERYGVDAWSTGFCYDSKLMETLDIKKEGPVNILGINSGFGSNPLKVKTLHKEAGNQEANLYFITDDERYIPDLQAYSEKVKYVPIISNDIFENVFFDYIIVESDVDKSINSLTLKTLKNKLLQNGKLFICAKDNTEEKMLESLKPTKKLSGSEGLWFIWIL